jgi:hypothetical protein
VQLVGSFIQSDAIWRLLCLTNKGGEWLRQELDKGWEGYRDELLPSHYFVNRKKNVGDD